MANARASLLSDLLCFDLYAASRAVTKAYGPLLADLDLTYPQYLVMIALWQSQPLGVKELAQRLSLDSGTLSPLLKRLESAGLVTRTRSSDDEREVSIGLTAKGRALQSKAAVVCAAMTRTFGMSHEEIRQLQSTLRQIRARMLDE
ncbi:MAG TPA: MarR family transcriptional regulator [Polyangiaceae bacterium]|jgi:DNA-binding MarR family transcriptional regulator